MEKTKYFYDGEVLLRFPNNTTAIINIQMIVEAKSMHGAYAALSDIIHTETILEFKGTMGKVLNSFDREENTDE